MTKLYLGIDVGTGSVRAGLFDGSGVRQGMGVEPITLHRPEEDFVEQSSTDIWRAAGVATRRALAEAGAPATSVAGIGFDATCSLVLVDAEDRPVSVGAHQNDEWNVIVWMDHRAIAETDRINATKHPVLRYVGGRLSPEMQTPKLLWLKESLPKSYARAARFFDLPDYLVYRATGADVRSLCTTVCKWTYLGHEGRFDPSYFEAAGLSDLAADDFRRIGPDVRALGQTAGALTDAAARELGLVAGVPVGVAVIDAHAGGLGMLGARGGDASEPLDFDRRLALIGGTSSCHMAASAEPRYIDGVWGPYFSAMVPDLWLTEGGQSATGALIDHMIESHARAPELKEEAARRDTTVYAILNECIARLAEGMDIPAALTRELHILPYFHGNRSPRADATLRGMISGLRLTASVDSLALLYLAAVQAIAHGTRHIVAALNDRGYAIDTLVACGGDMKNPVFVREHADISGCRILRPREPEAVLLGSALLGAVAGGAHPSIVDAMRAMGAVGEVVEPNPRTRGYHDAKHEVFQRMHADQLAYRALLGPPEHS